LSGESFLLFPHKEGNESYPKKVRGEKENRNTGRNRQGEEGHSPKNDGHQPKNAVKVTPFPLKRREGEVIIVENQKSISS